MSEFTAFLLGGGLTLLVWLLVKVGEQVEDDKARWAAEERLRREFR